ncbi:MAG: bifunctional histidinol-phosphatase/imidazoleglycerol-phosphate dehydratase HisB [Prevotellaceae bacterium]|jgi:imidazoleglycerol-phosphate dehydratase/histidinol-phosphatase|nr:bifunctional histidinol-phosphatase/imidazoleglycerol-phosphate dehydratase HisB [Prevotellaceae bacterium]
MKKILFIDRDGTLVVEPPEDFQIDSLEKLEFYPNVFQYLSRIAKELDYELVMVTNQDGLGTDSFPESAFLPAHNKIIKAMENEGIRFSDIHIDRSFPHENLPTRKPAIGMLLKYMSGEYNLADSYVIGDRITDVELAKNLGAKSIFIGTGNAPDADLTASGWDEIYAYLKTIPRKAKIVRKTSETDIEIVLNIDGSGQSEISTELGFFDHMLEQIAKHGNMDLQVKVRGDLHIDEHHTVEDTAIALGTAFLEALGSKKGVERYGFVLPMDDCLAQVAIDFGGRPWLVWDADFRREKIGDVPTEMFMHFFKSFSDNAKCNLNIKASGNNEHHKIESIFKAFAKAVKNAVRQTDNFNIPSTKGSI